MSNPPFSTGISFLAPLPLFQRRHHNHVNLIIGDFIQFASRQMLQTMHQFMR
jgi:hypothetical protein